MSIGPLSPKEKRAQEKAQEKAEQERRKREAADAKREEKERKKREKEEKVKGPGLFGKLKEMVKKAENLLDDENDNF